MKKAVSKIIQTMDILRVEDEYFKYKFLETYILVDRDARNVLLSGLPNGMLKSSISFNYYNKRDNNINLKEKTEIYPQCIVTKD